MTRDAIERYFRNKSFPDEGVPIDVTGTGDLESALQDSNHASTTSNDAEVAKVILEEVRLRRLFVVYKAMTSMVQFSGVHAAIYYGSVKTMFNFVFFFRRRRRRRRALG